jgi:hypothetical protein
MLEQLTSIKNKVQSSFAKDYTLSSLRIMVLALAIFFVALSWIIDNKWVLAGIVAYMVLP